MKTRLSTVFSLVILASMVLAACGTVTTVAPTSVPVATATQAVVAPQATNTTAPQPTAVPPTVTPTAEPPRTGGWLDQVVFTGIPDAQPAVAQLQAGAIDVYNVQVGDADLFNTVKGDKNLSFAQTFGGFDQLMFNTVQCTDKNILNPFTDAKIREAMNWAIDRNYMAQEIHGGLATPRYTVVDDASPDAALYAADMAAMATKYAYNMDKAKAVVDAEMPTLGATKDANGKWQFKGKPVTLIGLIRTEDARKQEGIYFAQQLEALGFTVDQQLKKRSEAAPIWQGDPAPCKFSYYTAGWVSSAITLDEGYMFAQYNSGDVQNIPLFLKYQPTADYVTVYKALENNTFKDMNERAQLFHQAFIDSMTESWHGVMTVNTVSFSPFSAKVTGATDIAAGFGSSLYPYTARFVGQTGGSLRIAESGPFVQAWNPIQGSNWVDDQYPELMTEDHGTMPDPYTGLLLPKLVTKMDVVVQTGVVMNKTLDWVTLKTQDAITVPDDAWADWDAKAQTFLTAKDRAAADKTYKQTAKVQVTVTYTPDLFKTKWHDGSTFSMADVIMGMILTFDPAKKDSKIYDEGYATSTFATYMAHFKGFKIVSTDPLTITTWDDKPQLNAESQAVTWYPSYGGNGDGDVYSYGTGAWHNLALGVAAEADGKMAFSLDKSSGLKVDETSLISGPTVATQMDYATKFAVAGDVPYAPTMSKYVTADEAKARYANLATFYKAHNHIWIGTGPYYIDSVDTTAKSITMKRFADYLFPSVSGYTGAPVAAATVDGPTQLKAGDEGDFTITVKNGDQPYASKDLASVSYTVFAADGTAAAQGTATMTAEGSYAIKLTSDVTGKLPAGSTSLSVAVSSKLVALPTFVTYQFVVTQ